MIRYANLKDAKRIATININGWRTAYKGIVSDEELAILDVEKATKNVRERLIAKPHEIIVIENETEIEGFIGFGTARDEDITKTCAEIYAVYLRMPAIMKSSSGFLKIIIVLGDFMRRWDLQP